MKTQSTNEDITHDEDTSLLDLGHAGWEVPKPPVENEVEARPKEVTRKLSNGVDLDLDALRLTPGYAKATAIVREQSTIPVDKPSKHAFFRVHADVRMDAMVLKYDVDGFCYLVYPAVAADLPAGLAKPCTLYFWMTRDGAYGLWPAGLPLDDGTDYPAWQSVHTVCATAMKCWVRQQWNKGAGSYDIFRFAGQDAAEPSWPDLDLRELVTKAFKGRVIESGDHVILRRLRGEL